MLYYIFIIVIFSDDKVANVRYSLCNIMPSLVTIFKTSTEKLLVNKLINAINKFLFDEDRIVQEQRPLLEYCNASLSLIIQVII